MDTEQVPVSEYSGFTTFEEAISVLLEVECSELPPAHNDFRSLVKKLQQAGQYKDVPQAPAAVSTFKTRVYEKVYGPEWKTLVEESNRLYRQKVAKESKAVSRALSSAASGSGRAPSARVAPVAGGSGEEEAPSINVQQGDPSTEVEDAGEQDEELLGPEQLEESLEETPMVEDMPEALVEGSLGPNLFELEPSDEAIPHLAAITDSTVSQAVNQFPGTASETGSGCERRQEDLINYLTERGVMSDTVRVVVQHDQYQYVYLRHDYQIYVGATDSQSVLSMDAWAVKRLDDLGGLVDANQSLGENLAKVIALGRVAELAEESIINKVKTVILCYDALSGRGSGGSRGASQSLPSISSQGNSPARAPVKQVPKAPVQSKAATFGYGPSEREQTRSGVRPGMSAPPPTRAAPGGVSRSEGTEGMYKPPPPGAALVHDSEGRLRYMDLQSGAYLSAGFSAASYMDQGQSRVAAVAEKFGGRSPQARVASVAEVSGDLQDGHAEAASPPPRSEGADMGPRVLFTSPAATSKSGGVEDALFMLAQSQARQEEYLSKQGEIQTKQIELLNKVSIGSERRDDTDTVSLLSAYDYKQPLPKLKDNDSDFEKHWEEFLSILAVMSQSKRGKPSGHDQLLIYRKCLPEGSIRLRFFDTWKGIAQRKGRLPEEADKVFEEIIARLKSGVGAIKEPKLTKEIRVDAEFNDLTQGKMSHSEFLSKWEEQLAVLDLSGVHYTERQLYRKYIEKLSDSLRVAALKDEHHFDGKEEAKRAPQTWMEVAEAVDRELARRIDIKAPIDAVKVADDDAGLKLCKFCGRSGHLPPICPKKAAESNGDDKECIRQFEQFGTKCSTCGAPEHRDHHHAMGAYNANYKFNKSGSIVAGKYGGAPTSPNAQPKHQEWRPPAGEQKGKGGKDKGGKGKGGR